MELPSLKALAKKNYSEWSTEQKERYGDDKDIAKNNLMLEITQDEINILGEDIKDLDDLQGKKFAEWSEKDKIKYGEVSDTAKAAVSEKQRMLADREKVKQALTAEKQALRAEKQAFIEIFAEREKALTAEKMMLFEREMVTLIDLLLTKG